MAENDLSKYIVIAIPLNVSGATQLVRGPIITEGEYEGMQYALWKQGTTDPGIGGLAHELVKLSEAPDSIRKINWFNS